jgi:hypothetical protein
LEGFAWGCLWQGVKNVFETLTRRGGGPARIADAAEAGARLLEGPMPQESLPLHEAKHLRVLMVTSDAGGDQAAAVRALAGRMLHGDGAHIIFIAQFCLHHQLHLVVLKSLRRLQSAGGYLSRLAQLAHSWRGAGNKVKAAFVRLCGEDVARQVANSPPPPPLKGRWGAVHKTEERLLLCGRGRLELVPTPQRVCWRGFAGFAASLILFRLRCGCSRVADTCTGSPHPGALAMGFRSGGCTHNWCWGQRFREEVVEAWGLRVQHGGLRASGTPRFVDVFGGGGVGVEAGNVVPDVELGLTGLVDGVDESTGEWQAKMSRWRAAAVAALQQETFWTELLVAHAVRTPVIHLCRWLEQSSSLRSKEPGGRSPVVELVCIRLTQLQNDLAKLLEDPATFDGIANSVLPGTWRPKALLLCLEQAADLQRRLIGPAADWPLSLAWLVWEKPGVACRARQHAAGRLLCRRGSGGEQQRWGQSPVAIDGASWLLSRVFEAELRVAADRGTICPQLHDFLLEMPGPQSSRVSQGVRQCGPAVPAASLPTKTHHPAAVRLRARAWQRIPRSCSSFGPCVPHPVDESPLVPLVI